MMHLGRRLPACELQLSSTSFPPSFFGDRRFMSPSDIKCATALVSQRLRVTIREGSRINRKLATARPDAFLPDLATSLNNLGTQQSDLGQREDVLASTRETVDIYRKLATARPDSCPTSRRA